MSTNLEGMVPSCGPLNAPIVIVGEAPGVDDVNAMMPLVGAAGRELDLMLAEAGIVRDRDCRVINVCPWRPPSNDIEELFYSPKEGKEAGAPVINGRYVKWQLATGYKLLFEELAALRPKVIIALGNVALWALTGEQSITKWRGSILTVHTSRYEVPLIPTYSPTSILRMWEWRNIAVTDLRRVSLIASGNLPPQPTKRFLIRPSFSDAVMVLEWLIEQAGKESSNMLFSHDIETANQQITCLGIAWNSTDSICLPFYVPGPEFESRKWSYWSYEEELAIIHLLQRLFKQPYHKTVGQNFIYDAQYLTAQWGIDCSNTYLDTMIAHHLLYPSLPKSLAFQSSIYYPWHIYWKDDGKEFNPSLHSPERHWTYNCEDTIRTHFIAEHLVQWIKDAKLETQLAEQMEVFRCCLAAMLRGVRFNSRRSGRMAMKLSQTIDAYEDWFRSIIPVDPTDKRKPWYRSPKQQAELFYDVLGVKPIYSREGNRTTDDDALTTIGVREPILKQITDTLSAYRTLNVLLNVLKSPTDFDGRMRCSYNPAGTETFRLSSSQSAFGSGTNLQNITTGEKYKNEDEKWLPEKIEYPNLRTMFIPDPGKLICEVDLERADAQVVAWDADDKELKQIFREGLDLHTENAKAIFGPRLGLQKAYRHRAKMGVHAVNYGVQARTLAAALGITVHEAQQFINAWLGAHPAIAAWHDRIAETVSRTRTLYNAFGYRQVFFGRPEGLFSEALAWIPQSTVALIINKAWINIVKNLPWVEVLLQTHDSLTFQINRSDWDRRALIREQLQVVVPYDDPLIIPVSIKTSELSWGEVESSSW